MPARLRRQLGDGQDLHPTFHHIEALPSASCHQRGVQGDQRHWKCAVDDQKAKWTAERIEAGVIWQNDWFVDGVNLPGGGYKKSGYGRDGGIDSLYSYGQTKRVCKRIN